MRILHLSAWADQPCSAPTAMYQDCAIPLSTFRDTSSMSSSLHDAVCHESGRLGRKAACTAELGNLSHGRSPGSGTRQGTGEADFRSPRGRPRPARTPQHADRFPSESGPAQHQPSEVTLCPRSLFVKQLQDHIILGLSQGLHYKEARGGRFRTALLRQERDLRVTLSYPLTPRNFHAP